MATFNEAALVLRRNIKSHKYDDAQTKTERRIFERLLCIAEALSESPDPDFNFDTGGDGQTNSEEGNDAAQK